MKSIYDIVSSHTVAWCVNLDAEHEGAQVRCLACGPGRYVHPVRLTEADLNDIALDRGETHCASCEKEIQ